MNVVVFITAKDMDEADKIALGLVQEKLVACVNIVKGVQSVFNWESKTEYCEETLLICKSKQEAFEGILAKVKELHSYSCPEVIAIPIVAGNPEYIKWVNESVR